MPSSPCQVFDLAIHKQTQLEFYVDDRLLNIHYKDIKSN